jgi:3-carboxy-cis,cis-muconate cycloisomerase
MSFSAFDNGLLSGLLGDDEIAPLFSAEAEIQQMVRFEAALAAAEGREGVIPATSADDIVSHLARFAPDLEAIRRATQRDGVVGVEFVRQLRGAVGSPLDKHVHFGATSQDLVDTALVLRLRAVLEIFEKRLILIRRKLHDLQKHFGERRIMGRTRMQDALPITVGDRLSSWDAPLERHLRRLNEMRPRLLVVQFGGPTGTLEALGDRAMAVTGHLAKALDLGAPARSWHSQRDNIVELADWLAQVSGSLGKIGADVCLMAQNSIAEIKLDGTGGSSAMPHKQNPVGAEVLVALAHYAATLVSGAHHALVHEQERSGSAWTLEWLVLPQMVATAGASLRNSITLLDQVTDLGEAR